MALLITLLLFPQWGTTAYNGDSDLCFNRMCMQPMR
jgi:hypothetical protein